jgi:hypothetical protein
LNLKVVRVFDDLLYLSDGVNDVGEAPALTDTGDSSLLEAADLGIEPRGFDFKGYKLAIPTAKDIGHSTVSWNESDITLAANKIDRFELLNEPAFAL